jgi:HSP90 family molecular chaperone
MQTYSSTSEVTREGAQTEATFTIKATSKAFDILSSGLYSDKIQAIVRELSCNAYDAHVAAGKVDVPIEIRLPTSLDPTFYVKDYGIGLDHEAIYNVFRVHKS